MNITIKKYTLAILILSSEVYSLERNLTVYIDSSTFYEASDITKKFVTEAAEIMKIKTPITLFASPLENAAGWTDHSNPDNPLIAIHEKRLLEIGGEVCLQETCYHEVGHVKDNQRYLIKALRSCISQAKPLIASSCMAIALLLSHKYSVPINALNLYSPLFVGWVIGKKLLPTFEKYDTERAEIAADSYACEALELIRKLNK